MIITKNKPEGQKILAKLRSEGHIWLSVPDYNKRMKFVPIGSDTKLYSDEEYVLCVINQMLHVCSYIDGKLVDEFREIHLPPKKMYGLAVEVHDR